MGKVKEKKRKMVKVRERKRKSSRSSVSGLYGPRPKIERFKSFYF